MGIGNFFFGGDATKGMASQPQNADWMRTHLKTSTDQAAPMVGQIDPHGQDLSRGQQGQLAGMLFGQASGAQPGAGELAVRRGIGQTMAQNTSAAQMARGANAALAMRNAARQNAAVGVDGAGQAAIAQMNDRSAAQGQLAGLLGTMRGQDLGARGQDIGVAQGNQSAQLAQQQQNLQALAQMLGVDVAVLQQDAARRGLALQDKGALPGLLQAGGQIGAAYATGGMSGAASAPTMSPIAAGNPGAGGYYTPGR